MRTVNIIQHPTHIVASFRYDKSLVDWIKQLIPSTARRFNPGDKSWSIDAFYVDTFYQLLSSLGYTQHISQAAPAKVHDGVYTRKLHYVGIPKKRFGGYYAFGMVEGGEWELQISREVLKAWFGEYSPNDPYSVLGLKYTDSITILDIKKAYRSVSKQWHPDVCHEPNAREMFEVIKDAYDKLGSEDKLREYNARKRMALKLTKHGLVKVTNDELYIPRKRCGLIQFRGRMEMGRLIVDEIQSWDDILNNKGESMVTWWDVGNNCVQIRWYNVK